ncbi:MAG TPA: glycosyltransferase [Bryobacteraceae bacterium]|nr:glycosyltransferase [Bryobacteraceae bacterium]
MNQLRSRLAVPVVIPAYKPGAHLLPLVERLLAAGAVSIIVIDDGSGPEFALAFDAVAAASERVRVLHHAVNLGKGAALKTGLNDALVRFPDCLGVVTADADGQHHPDDILLMAKRLAEDARSLVLGVRSFGDGAPLRSRLGNHVTRLLMRVVTGQKLGDTQTGLRGIPTSLIPHLLRMPSGGYEFELDMLLACKHQGFPILEQPIRTIYMEGNRSSHFRPVLDSMRIYFLLFRFSVLSVLTAALDNVIFSLVFFQTGGIAPSQTISRMVAMVFNYFGVRGIVFHSRQRQAVVLPRYVLLVFCNGLVSYGLIRFLHDWRGLPVIPAKLLAEGLLFIANFAIQRDFVFTRRETSRAATDWDRYYSSVPFTARLTRRYTTSVLLNLIRRYATAGSAGKRISIVELGGANSCLLETISAVVGCADYDVVDTNEYGLSLLRDRSTPNTVVRPHRESVLDLSLKLQADVVFSVGLIEHFQPRDTRRAILAHFDAVRPGGTAIITWPAPTVLYRITRTVLEAVGLWNFPDERPLKRDEVRSAIRERGEIVHESMLWPLLLTQAAIVAIARGPLRSSETRTAVLANKAC